MNSNLKYFRLSDLELTGPDDIETVQSVFERTESYQRSLAFDTEVWVWIPTFDWVQVWLLDTSRSGPNLADLLVSIGELKHNWDDRLSTEQFASGLRDTIKSVASGRSNKSASIYISALGPTTRFADCDWLTGPHSIEKFILGRGDMSRLEYFLNGFNFELESAFYCDANEVKSLNMLDRDFTPTDEFVAKFIELNDIFVRLGLNKITFHESIKIRENAVAKLKQLVPELQIAYFNDEDIEMHEAMIEKMLINGESVSSHMDKSPRN